MLFVVFGHLVKLYVDTMVNGGIPCLENAVLAMAQIENDAAVREGRQVYEDGMTKLKSRFPVLLGDLTAEHERLNSLAIEAFMKRSFKDDDGTFMRSLEVACTPNTALADS